MAVPTVAPLAFVTVIVKPIASPALTEAASAVFWIERLGAFGVFVKVHVFVSPASKWIALGSSGALPATEDVQVAVVVYSLFGVSPTE